MDTLQNQILIRVHRQGSGGVFTPKDFLDLGSRDAVDQALSRLVRKDQLQRLARGLYYFPRINARFSIVVPPDADQIAHAIGRQTGSRVVPSGAVAANRFGLTTQVPARPVYFTDGNSRQVRIGDMVFQMKHASPRDFPPGSHTSALVFQAIRYLGKDAVDDHVINTIRRTLSPRQRTVLLRDGRFATDWIAAVIRRIAAVEQPEMVHG